MMQEPDIKLEPCPFCGQNVRFQKTKEGGFEAGKEGEFEIWHPFNNTGPCPFYESESYDTEEELQEAWNRREYK